MTDAPRTIMLIHGFWMTPLAWEGWIPYYEAQGYRVLAPAYPGFEVGVDALHADPSPILDLDVRETVDHYAQVLDGLDEQPIIIGHSAGGLFLQLLLDRGYGAAGVAISSAPTEGVRVTPSAQLRALFPILRDPRNRRRAVSFSPERWRHAFANAVSQRRSRELYDRYHVPASGRLLFAAPLSNFTPGHQETWVDYSNEHRAPLLFISGGRDNLMPPGVQRANARRYATLTPVEVKVFPEHGHAILAEPGWQQVADVALEWAVEHARTRVRH